MANSEKSKMKVLLLYDYFLHHVNAFDDDTGVAMGELRSYLSGFSDTEFERKSIYADIDRINEFARTIGLVDSDDNWIYLCGRKYTRKELKNELTMDEAILLVDAIRTTQFTDSGLCEKIERMYPSYFSKKKNNHAFYANNAKIPSRIKFNLVNLRKSIENKNVIVINYGYGFAGGIRAASEKTVSPYALDWQNNKYYLIAVDHGAYDPDNEDGVMSALRRYRLDRIQYVRFVKNDRFIEVKDKEKLLKNYMQNSLDAFSGTEGSEKTVEITLEGPDEKSVIKAYNLLESDIGPGTGRIHILKDRTEQGYLKISLSVVAVSTLYPILFKLYTFDDITVTFGDSPIKDEFISYLNKAVKSLK